MVEYKCECCHYITAKKSNINNHNVSKKHLDKSKEIEEASIKLVSQKTNIVSKKVNLIQPNEQKQLEMTEGFIYLLREREFIKTNENIYKIGKSKQEFGKRFSQYPNQSQMYLHLYVNDVDKFEKTLIDLFSIEFNKRIDIGYEYFEGNVNNMLKLIFNCYFNVNFNKINVINDELQDKINNYIINKEKEKTNEIEKINLRLEKQKIKEEKLIKDKEKLEQLKKTKMEKLIFQKTEEEKNNQKKIKRNLFGEIKEKISSMITNKYFTVLHVRNMWFYDELRKCKTLNEILKKINSFINEEIKKIYNFINSIYDSEIISKIKIKNVKKILMLKICNGYNDIIPKKIITQIREKYCNKEDVVKMDMIYYEMGELKYEFVLD
jgi:hypothetical protein